MRPAKILRHGLGKKMVNRLPLRTFCPIMFDRSAGDSFSVHHSHCLGIKHQPPARNSKQITPECRITYQQAESKKDPILSTVSHERFSELPLLCSGDDGPQYPETSQVAPNINERRPKLTHENINREHPCACCELLVQVFNFFSKFIAVCNVRFVLA